jgi:hypothetical protein
VTRAGDLFPDFERDFPEWKPAPERAPETPAQYLRGWGWSQAYYPPERGESVATARVWTHPRFSDEPVTLHQAVGIMRDTLHRQS